VLINPHKKNLNKTFTYVVLSAHDMMSLNSALDLKEKDLN